MPATAAAAVDHRELQWARFIEVGGAPGDRAVSCLAVLRRHRHREVVAINEADIVEVKAVGAVKGELRQGGRRDGPGAGALHGSRATVSSEADEFASGGVLGAQGASPHSAGPGGGDGQGVGLTGQEGEAGGGGLRYAGAGEDPWPHGVATLVDECECGRLHTFKPYTLI